MKTCDDCLVQKQAGGMCPIFGEKVNPADRACRKYIGHDSPKCDMCGALMPGKPEVVIMEDGDTIISCGNCAAIIGMCGTCSERTKCDFETSPINIPKQVQKVVRQGNMQMQTVIRNPEREKETCMKGCPCWDSEECICLRQSAGSCKAWRYK